MTIYRLLLRKFNQLDNINKSLFLSCLTGLVILIARVLITKQFTFLFLIWNLFLAYIPLFISRLIIKKYPLHKPGIIFFIISFIWLIFFPNAPYILTDFIHLYQRENIPLWFDLIIISLFAWNGLIIGFISLKNMQNVINHHYSIKTGWYFAIFAIGAGSFGVYIGRFLRYNSWDVFFSPFSLLKNIASVFINPLDHKTAFGMTLFMGLFLVATYYNFIVFTLHQQEFKRTGK